MTKKKDTQEERIYQWHLKQKARDIDGKKHTNNAAIARKFHCSREWVRLVIIRAEKAKKLESEAQYRKTLAEIEERDQRDAIDTLVER